MRANLLALAVLVSLPTVACKNEPKAGPPVAWRATIGKEVWDAVAAPNATLLTVGEQGVTAWSDGKQTWQRPLESKPTSWVLALGADLVLAGDEDGRVYGIALADGTVRWKHRTPAEPRDPDRYADASDSADTVDDTRPWVRDAASTKEGAILLLSDNRFARLDAAACLKGETGCMTESGGLKPSAEPDEIAVASDGTRVIWSFGWVALFDRDGKRIAGFSADDIIGGVAVVPEGIFVAHDKGVARIDASKCKMDDAEGRIALGTRDDRDPAPPGCLERIVAGEVEASSPAASRNGVAWVADAELQGRAVGKSKGWTADVHAAGGIATEGDIAYVGCWQEPEGNDVFVTIADLCAVSLENGGVKWRSKLGLGRAGLLDATWIVSGGGMVYVMLKDDAVALKIPG